MDWRGGEESTTSHVTWHDSRRPRVPTFKTRTLPFYHSLLQSASQLASSFVNSLILIEPQRQGVLEPLSLGASFSLYFGLVRDLAAFQNRKRSAHYMVSQRKNPRSNNGIESSRNWAASLYCAGSTFYFVVCSSPFDTFPEPRRPIDDNDEPFLFPRSRIIR